jgi:hypothetical protein
MAWCAEFKSQGETLRGQKINLTMESLGDVYEQIRSREK